MVAIECLLPWPATVQHNYSLKVYVPLTLVIGAELMVMDGARLLQSYVNQP